MFEPIAITRAYENIVAQVEAAIIEGNLAVGDQLPGERELAEQFEVSRVVIREATRNLEARGIVEVRRGSGTYVKSIPSPALTRSLTLLLKLEEASLLELYVVRQALELVSASAAAQHATSEEIAALRTCLEEMSRLLEQEISSEDDFRVFSDKDTEFHLLIAQASHNLPLETLLSAILPLVMSGRAEIISRTGGFQQFIVRSEPQNAYEEQTHIVNAIANRDPKAAEHFTYLHLQRSVATFRDLE